jgi:hypothetical protein
MKHLRLVLCLTVVALFAHVTVTLADSFDSDMATIKKKSDHSAKVLVDKKTYVVPISFGDGASWDSVKDHYELSEASEAILASGHAKLSVGSDGTASWSKK